MKYNMKYFNENAHRIESEYCFIYDMDGHRIAVCRCDRCARRQYYNVCVDGVTIATRCKESNAIGFALKYLNEQTA